VVDGVSWMGLPIGGSWRLSVGNAHKAICMKPSVSS
jgi:hypothetical protein